MPRIRFIDVGRNKLTWEEELANVDSDSMARAIKRRGALMSTNVWIEDSIIFAGFRSVGRTELVVVGRN